MTREELREASDLLREAAAEVADDDVEERIYDQSRQMAELATADRGPDQGRLDRHMNALRDISGQVDGEAGELVDAAYDRIREYRSTVGGV